MAIAGIILLGGLLLTFFGRRGWRTGHHLHCGYCEFDLFGLPTTTSRCPECGRDILSEDSVRLGRRHPLRAVMGVGAAVTVIGVGLLVVQAVLWWPQFDASRYKPVSWLSTELRSGDDALSARACSELVRRVRGRELAPSQLDPVADYLLAEQANLAVAWNARWGDLLQAAHGSGVLSADRWRRYLEQSMQLSARVRSRISSGDPVPLELSCRLRAGSDYQAMSPATIKPRITATFGQVSSPIPAHAVPLDTVPAPVEWTVFWMPSRSENPLSWPAPGRNSMELALSITLTDRNGVAAVQSSRLMLPLELLPRGESSVSLLSTPAEAAEMETAVKLRPARVRPRLVPGGAVGLLTPNGLQLGSLLISGPPVTVAFRVVLRQKGRDASDLHEWPLARLMVKSNDAISVPLTLRSAAPAPVAGPAELVCVPDVELATGTVDVMEVWGGEIHRPMFLMVMEPTGP